MTFPVEPMPPPVHIAILSAGAHPLVPQPHGCSDDSTAPPGDRMPGYVFAGVVLVFCVVFGWVMLRRVG